MTLAEGRLLVLKLGGSLARSQRLAQISDLVAQAAAPVVVVPGGGVFAEAVRTAQSTLALSDGVCHRLALLAMHQMGLVIASRNERFVPCETLDDIARAVDTNHIPVWLPLHMQAEDPALPADWTTTSDALAARLAERMTGAGVALVKSCGLPPGCSLMELAGAGVVDPVFGRVVTRAQLPWIVYGAGDESALARRLQSTG